jgi:two-component system cell cycle sensor histidine kinase/response regulator CckA
VTYIVRDITLRRRAEDALRASNRRIERMLEHITDAFVALDREWRFTDLNSRAEQIVGRAREELLGQSVWEEFPALVASPIYSECQRAAAEQRPVEFSVHSEPFHLWLDVRVYPTEKGLSLYFQDVTARRKLEERSAQSQRLEALGRLAGGVAHDFNNLLTIIGGYGQMIRDAAGGEVAKDARIIVDAAARASALTRQLLAFSRRQVVQPKILDLNRLIVRMIKLLRRLISEDIQLELKLRPDLGRILADPGQIEQVIMNLAVNARDAMPGGGKLSLRTSNYVVREEADSGLPLAPGQYVLLEVCDTGVGMDEETRSHIFEPFFTTKEKDKGTGLGLATAYGIAKQSGAEISVESEPGKGACFRIHFPRVSKVHRPREAPVRHKLARGTETILLVEDDAEVRTVARGMLSRLGYHVLEAGGPVEALEVWRRDRDTIDLVLTDVVMPQMSAGEMAAQMRRDRSDLKVLCMSGYTDDMIARAGLEEGTRVLHKPFSREALASTLRAALDAPLRSATSGSGS